MTRNDIPASKGTPGGGGGAAIAKGQIAKIIAKAIPVLIIFEIVEFRIGFIKVLNFH